MNDDLISRKALNDIWELYKRYHRVGTNFHEFGVALKEIIDNAPTVEAYPFEQVQELVKLNQQFAQEIENMKRTTGEWIDDKNDSHYANCSCCGYQIDTHYERGYLNFCHNCGADMRGGRE